MKRLTSPQKHLLSILILTGLCIFFITFMPAKTNQSTSVSPAIIHDPLVLSHESGFYAEPLTLEIFGENIKEIYYTLDGSDPSRENQTAYKYEKGIPITNEETEKPWTVRILAYFEDGTTSGIINRTFITGDSVHSRYDVPVLTLSAPEGFFLGEESGIFWGNNKFDMSDPEYEREIFMTLFDETGTVLLSQNCGFRIHGHFSRTKNQPSFRLCARSQYDEQNDFEYMLFSDQYSVDNTLISEHKRLVARNSGNDNGYAFIRSELASRLSLDAGFRDTPHSIPIAVYLNDTYYGFYWLISHFNDTYYRETYGEYDGTMYTLTGVINELSVEESGNDEATIALVEEYNEKIAFYESCDLNNEENWASLNAFMDVENFLQYMAIQNYTCNMDSLHNNYKIYRYVAPPNGTYQPDSVFDGKYRFLLYDLDFAFGYEQHGQTLSAVDFLMTHILLIQERDSYTFFQNLLKRKDCQEYYIRYMLSLQNYYFSPTYACNIMNEMHAERTNELRYTYTTTDLLLNNDCAPNVTCDEDIQVALDDIRYFLENRPYYITEDLTTCFGPFTTYELFMDNSHAANISLDYVSLNDSFFSGIYYKEIPLMVQATPKPGYRFDYWLINGEQYNQTCFEITQEMVLESSLYLECICSPDPNAELTITAIKPNVGEDYIEITNLGSVPRYLNNYYLTDSDAGTGSSLPAITLQGGETVTIFCNNYSQLDALGQPYVNFNLKAGETLSLYANNQTLLQTVKVPSLGTENGIYKMDMTTGIFREVSND